MIDKLPIYDKTFQLTLLITKRATEFDRKLKFTLGDNMIRDSLDALKDIVYANMRISADERRKYLQHFLAQIEIIKSEMRLSSDMLQMSDKSAEAIDQLIADVAKQARNWVKYISKGESAVGGNADSGEPI